MKVKELYKKYKGYTIMLFGKPLTEETTPFTHLPNKDIDICEVVEYKVEDKKKKVITHNFKNNKTALKETKGDVYAYIK